MADEKKKYSEKELDELFEKAGKQGALLCLLHFDSYGRDKETVKAALVDLIGRINAEKGVVYCRGEIEEVLESEDEKGKTVSTYTEVKALFVSLDVAISVCMRYGPITIEVLHPKELKLNLEQLQNTLLSASSVSQQFSNYFMTKLSKKEDLEEFQDNLKRRIAHGKDLMKQSQTSNETEKKKDQS
jgi:hypothetical protein